MAAAACAAPGKESVGLLPITRKDNFAEWYREVIDEAELAETSVVPGCMVIRSWGYGVWEQIQRTMDDLFKEGRLCKNHYFPLFIPKRLLEAEADHVQGFAKEMAVVTHYRMKVDETGKLVVDEDAKLGEPLVVRPTSETIIGESFKAWIRSYRDLPLLVNQWANVVRWEHATRPFLRTTEFLWQEGHCVFANQEEAEANALKMARFYQAFMTEVCALPVILGEKSEGERFAGADRTYCLEAMMQDGKAVQAGTSHYLGTHFSKAADIQFDDEDGQRKFAHTTSWGVSTRLVGALIMTHSDDFGLRLPPRLAPYHIVIIPSGKATQDREDYIGRVIQAFRGHLFAERKIAIEVDERTGINAGEKGWHWVRKGVPLRFEIGPREAERSTVSLSRRDQEDPKGTEQVPLAGLVELVTETLEQMQRNYYSQAEAFRDAHIRSDIGTFEEICAFFANKDNIGFVKAKWCGDRDTEEMLKKEYQVTIRCLPSEQSGTEGTCVLTGRPAKLDAIFGRSY